MLEELPLYSGLNNMGMDRKGVFTTAKAQLQAQSEHDSMVKVLFLRGKLNRLWKTFDDKVRFHLPIRIFLPSSFAN
jgi:hypothetical protein